ncbi:hypothetical protein BU23DRAFT_568017 [Bimuria novae-zelandiae CBS 107.79]|uniref:Uncharacterized protein n=1 Tax=Bimuria novae-zelandiae CBS 107.79 TaxID=1447943 RepID=A0A6A5VC90_9PLEO|nr:hypothetical protein BU23DRAFT_568017 [Bimuria novae-zelandiae CBS 107.79]
MFLAKYEQPKQQPPCDVPSKALTSSASRVNRYPKIIKGGWYTKEIHDDTRDAIEALHDQYPEDYEWTVYKAPGVWQEIRNHEGTFFHVGLEFAYSIDPEDIVDEAEKRMIVFVKEGLCEGIFDLKVTVLGKEETRKKMREIEKKLEKDPTKTERVLNFLEGKMGES